MTLTAEQVFHICSETITEARASVPEDDRPHPLVGASLVGADGSILVRAHRGERPKRHAEFCLLEKAQEQGIDATSCTLFVTLEPCIRRGPDKIPCAVRVRQAGIKKVYIGTLDPDPRITGRGEMYLMYEGITVEHFPSELAKELQAANRVIFDQFRAAHFWDPPPPSLYGAGGMSPGSAKPLPANTRDGLLYQTLDLMISSRGGIWISAGDLSWFRELQVAFLAASLNRREVRVIHQIEEDATGLHAIAACLGSSVVRLPAPAKLRFTLVAPKTATAAAVCVDSATATLLRMPEDEGLLELLTDWFEDRWTGLTSTPGRPVSVQRIEPEHVLAALRVHVPQYRNAHIGFEEVAIDSVRPSTHLLESFKLFRLNQFVALRARYDLPDLARIDGSPWPLISLPVIERLPDGQMVIIDGTHRTYCARARGEFRIHAIVVDNPNFDLPSQPPLGWGRMEILPRKLTRQERYKKFEPSLFRPIRVAFESLATAQRTGLAERKGT